MKTAAIILAAGFSSRMGQDKALLPFGETTALELLVSAYRQAGVGQIMVVTGSNHTALAQLSLRGELVQNPVPADGMFSSVKLGAARLDPNVDAFFVQPVDTPLVKPETLQALLNHLQQQDSCCVIPCCDGKRGHPPLLRAALIDSMLAYDGNGGLRGLLSRFSSQELQVDDQGVLLGMNTPQQYQALLQYWHGLVLAAKGGDDELGRA